MNSVPEIRRERIFIPPETTTREIREKYALTAKRVRAGMKQGFFVKNHSKKQIIIEPENFDPAVSYSTAKRVYFKNFSWRPLAQSRKDDLIQEAVMRMYELSGKVKENANDKYGIGYGHFWVAHNTMVSFFNTWRRQMRYQVSGDIEDRVMAPRIHPSSQEML